MAKKRANGEGNIRKRADGRWGGATQRATTPKPESASSKMYLVKRRRNARQS